MPAHCIAVVGAESTGKTTLAGQLHAAIVARLSAGGGRAALVPETLREWCDATGRTPRPEEQRQILELQHQRIEAAARTHDVVVCDTTALMTAVYSRLLFRDRSLEAAAVALHRRIGTTLLTALDLPWMADGHQRDGAHVREPVDTLLRELLLAHAIEHAVVGGTGPARLAQAEAALRASWPPSSSPPSAAAPASLAPSRIPGLFTRLQDGDRTPLRAWTCDCCVPEAERALLGARPR